MISQLRSNDKKADKVNLNNVPVPEQVSQNETATQNCKKLKQLTLCSQLFLEIFDALRDNKSAVELSMANCAMSDAAAAGLAAALESNDTLEKLNIESNKINPHTLIGVFEALNVQQVLKEIKASNQQAQFLGNKVEMAITKAVENNKTILKVGLHFEFGDCRWESKNNDHLNTALGSKPRLTCSSRNRVAVQLQKNLDRVRLKRVAHKLSTGAAPSSVADPPKPANGSASGSRTGGYIGALPGQISHLRQKSPEEEEDEEEEEEEEDER